MCGIAGILGRIGEQKNRDALARMSRAMLHRGPDGDGSWSSPPDVRGLGVLLAHRRLSILDLSSAGAQPMRDPTTGDVIALNGEIYNFTALRETLTAAGERFQSTGDTAVALRALARDGEDAVRSFRGMFAFAFFDASARTLTLARDPLGIKPLYLMRNPDPGGSWTVAFASEVRALLASGLIASPRLDAGAVASVVWNGFVVSPDTIISGIESLLPGELLVLDCDGRRLRGGVFWNASALPDSPPIREADLSQELRECVRLHLTSDVPVGVFLSSGVDSSAVANLARTAGSPVRTFTLSFEEQELDEGSRARAIAHAIGTEHSQVTLTESRFVAQLETALDCLDQPTFDGINTYYISQAFREAGFKVALVGTGGDELFGGYSSFRHLPALAAVARRMRIFPTAMRVAAARALVTALHRRRGVVPPQTRWAKLPEMVRRGDDLLALYQLAYALFLPAFQEQLLSRVLGDAPMDGLPVVMRDRLESEIRARSHLSAISVMEQRLFLGERLLRDSDAASMAASIELRLPLVDRVLFEQVDRLSDRQRYAPVGRKVLLRRLGLAGLDPALFAGPKRGFVLPFDRWLRRSLGALMDRTLRDPVLVGPTGLDPDAVARLWRAFVDSAPGMYWSRVWAVYVLVRWCSRFGVRL